MQKREGKGNGRVCIRGRGEREVCVEGSVEGKGYGEQSGG